MRAVSLTLLVLSVILLASPATCFLSAPALRAPFATKPGATNLCTAGQFRAASFASSAAYGSTFPRLRGPGRSVVQTRMALDIAVEDLPGSQKKLSISVSADECSKAYESVLGKLIKTAEVPGFRKGKAPPAMVLNHFGKESVSAEACEQIIGAAVPLALQQKEIRAIGQAKMADDDAVAKMLDKFKPGESVNFEVLVDVWPEASLKGDYTGITVEAEEEPIEEELLTNALSEIRKREALSIISGADTKTKVYVQRPPPPGPEQPSKPSRLPDDPAEYKAEGNIAVVDLVGFKKNADGSKGDKLPDLAIGENVEVPMEKGKFFEGFVESIEGMQAGDEALVPVTFPSNHKVPELQGMEALFEVKIKALKDSVYPALTDEFAAKISETATVDDLKLKIRKSIGQESIVSTEKNINRALEDHILTLVDVEIPETLIDEQTKTKFAGMMSDFKAKGMDDDEVKKMITKENFDKYKASSRDNTVRALTISFVIGEIAKKEGIKVDPAEVEGEMQQLRAQYEDDMDEEQARSRVEAELERQKVLEFLKENNEIKLSAKKEQPKEEASN